MARKKRRIRSPHPGVVIQRRDWPTGRVTWRARYQDPDTGRTVYLSLDKLGLKNDEARRNWAIKKSKSNATRRADIASGAPLRTIADLEEEKESFLERHGLEVKKATIEGYRRSIDLFMQWAKRNGIELTEDLTPAKLHDFRTYLMGRQRRNPLIGGRRGEFKKVTSRRSPATTNRDLTAVRVMLNSWRRHGLLTKCDSDAIKDATRHLRRPKPMPTFLRPRKVRMLLEATLRHDAETFELTRAEKNGLRAPGTTPSFPPIGPFVLSVLLTGGRFTEVAGLRWEDVDLQTNAIYLGAEATKTGEGRRIDLSVSPSLLSMFAAMKLRSGGARFVFRGDAPVSSPEAKAAQYRLVTRFGAPSFNWQELRRTCGTYLTCAPGIYGAASAFLSAKRLGHSVMVAERHYAGAVTDIPAEAKTLEAALAIDELAARVAGICPGEERNTKNMKAGG